MRKLIAWIKTFKPLTEKERAYIYLSESVDHVDLERRIKELDRLGYRYY